MHEFAPKAFFHHVKNLELLKKFFVEAHQISDFPLVNEKMARGAAIDRLTEFYDGIDAKTREPADKGLVLISRMATERGISLLNNLAKAYNDIDGLEKNLDGGFHDRALWFYLEKNGIFNEAVAIDEFYDQQGWKRHPAPKKSMSVIQNKKDVLRAEFSKIFRDESRSRNCIVEMYKREECLYIVVSFEDYPQVASQMKDDGEIDRAGFFRPLKQIYFLYTPEDEELQIKYNGPWEERDKYLETFLRVAFDKPLQDAKQTFDLEPLKNPNFNLNYGKHAEAVESWLLKFMDLEVAGTKNKIKLSVPAKSATKTGAGDMWDLLGFLNLAGRMGELRINQVEIAIRFRDPNGRNGVKSVSFKINWKDNCTLCKLNGFEKMTEEILQTSKINYGFGKKASP